MGALKPIALTTGTRYALRDYLNQPRETDAEMASVIHEAYSRCDLFALTGELKALESDAKARGEVVDVDALAALGDAPREFTMDHDVLTRLREGLKAHTWGRVVGRDGQPVTVGVPAGLMYLVHELQTAIDVAISGPSCRERAGKESA